MAEISINIVSGGNEVPLPKHILKKIDKNFVIVGEKKGIGRAFIRILKKIFGV